MTPLAHRNPRQTGGGRQYLLSILRVAPLLACITVWATRAEEQTPLTRLFDTGASSAKPLLPEALARQVGWELIPEDTVEHSFSGDAVILNDKLIIVMRKQGRGTEVYAKTASGVKHRTTLAIAGDGSSATGQLDTLKIVENSSSAVMVEAGSRGAVSSPVRYRLTAGEALLEARPGEATGGLTVRSKTRYVVVPDYFGDDMVFEGDVAKDTCLPAENFCLNLIDGGDAIVMSVWQSNEQDVWLTSTRSEKDGTHGSIRIGCVKGKSVWLAFLETPGLWHVRPEVGPSDWKPPFPAKWRSSFIRQNAVADSWDMDHGPDPAQTAAKHQGPLIVYPIDRTPATPLTVSCPTDVMRNTLGVGPCQYILACEGMAAQGDPTPNSVMNWVEKQFAQKKDRKVADDITERLEQMCRHVTEARSRIGSYLKFASQVRKLSGDKQGSSPLLSIVDDLERFVAAGLLPESGPERTKALAGKVSALIGKENTLAECQRLGAEMRSIGAVQDGTLAKCRMAVRRLRQEGRTLGVDQTQDGALGSQVRRLAEEMLRKPANNSETGH